MSNILKLNAEIIAQEASLKDFHYTGDNIFSYDDWGKKGYRPVRGQQAFIKPYLWTMGEHRRKKIVGLFTSEQVLKVS